MEEQRVVGDTGDMSNGWQGWHCLLQGPAAGGELPFRSRNCSHWNFPCCGSASGFVPGFQQKQFSHFQELKD